MSNFKKVKRKPFSHHHVDEDEVSKQEKEQKQKEQEEKEKYQQEWEAREAEIWPKKKPVPKRNVKPASYNNNNSNNAPVANNSGVGKGGREYSKPWQVNAKDPKKPKKERSGSPSSNTATPMATDQTPI